MQTNSQPTRCSTVYWTAGLLLVSAILIFFAFHWDAAFRAWVVTTQGTNWKQTSEYVVFAAISKYGDWPQLIGMGAVAAFVAWRLRSPDWSKIIVTAVIASVLAGLLVDCSRFTTGRTRPDASPKIAQGWYGPYHNGRILIGVHSYNSFPSGHTATAVGMAAVILFSRPFWGIPCMLVALSIVASRLYLGKHHLSDVVVSTLVGLAVGWYAWRVSEEKGDAILSWVKAKFFPRSPPSLE